MATFKVGRGAFIDELPMLKDFVTAKPTSTWNRLVTVKLAKSEPVTMKEA